MEQGEIEALRRELRVEVDRGRNGRAYHVHRNEWPKFWEIIDQIIEEPLQVPEYQISDEARYWAQSFILSNHVEPGKAFLIPEEDLATWFDAAIQSGKVLGVIEHLDQGEEPRKEFPLEVVFQDDEPIEVKILPPDGTWPE